MVQAASTVKAHQTDDGLVLQVHAHDEDETTKVIASLTALLGRIDGKEGNTSVPSPAWGEEFAVLFDEASLQARVKPVLSLINEQEVELEDVSYEGYKKHWIEIQERGYGCQVIDTHRFMTGAFDFTVKLTKTLTDEPIPSVHVRTAAMIKNGKIVFCEQKISSGPKQSVIVQAVEAPKKTKAPPDMKSSWAFASVSDLGDSDEEYHEDETIKAAIRNFKALIMLQNGEGKEPPEGYADHFAKVFDKKVTAKVKPLTKLTPETTLLELDYDGLYQQAVEAYSLGYKAEVVRVKPHMKGVVAFTVHMESEESELTQRSTVFIHENGLITNVEATETIYREKPKPSIVSGQVEATDAKAIEGFKSEKELADAVLPVSGKILAGHKSGIKPCMVPGSVVKLYMEREKKLLRLQAFKEGSVPVFDSEGNPYAGGVHFKEYKRRVVTGKALVLNDANGEPRALCFQDFVVISRKAFDVYSTRPLWSGDAPFEKEGDILCYPWFRMEQHGDHHRQIQVWNGRGYQSMWRAFLGKKPGKDDVNPQHPPNKGDIVLKTASLDADLAYITVQDPQSKGEHVRYNITIAPGVDPGLVLCLAGVLEIMAGLFD